MFSSAFQLTLREMRDVFSSPRTLAAMLVIGVLLGLIGPFSTFQYFLLAPRIAYWVFIVLTCYGVGAFGGGFVVNIMHQLKRQPNVVMMIIGGGIGAGLPVAVTVTIANATILGDWEISGFEGVMTLVYCVLVSMCITALHVLFLREDRPSAPKQVPILARLQIQNRGKLLYMSMQDHYINVVTSRGQELLLLRMGDAEKETTGIDGLRIHRSHWIAIEGIKSVDRQNGNYVVEMLDGAKLPISRGQVQAARDAGIIPN